MIKNFLKFVILKLIKYWIRLKSKFDRLAGETVLETITKKGEYCRLEGYGTLIDSQNLVLGDHVSIGRNFFIRATGGITIGNYSHISRNVTIHTVNHNINGTQLPYDRNDLTKKIQIGQYVWVGMNCSILSGVTIGDGAIVGMGTVVTKDIPPGDIVSGPSQRKIGSRDRQLESALLSEGAFLKN